ncbi:hypothetical protein BKA61DRAFT_179008 [Leptodontidium sp. MPI-SDFR-AT-0119]|nr:hypothetical protein BKA61DRAFT_179008 [Leptodontidium sp. MPI-SDFR-AT-0119]
MDDFQCAFWEEEMGADWLTDSHEMLADVNFDEDGNTPAFALEMNGGGGLASSYSLLSATSATATATIAKTVEQEQIAQATPVEVASIAPSNAIEEQVATPISNQFPTLKVESIEEQRLDSTYLKDVAPVSSSNLVEQQTVASGSFDQLTSASTNANEHQNSASGSSDPFAIVSSDAGEDGSFPPEFFDEIWHDNADTDERPEFETASDQFAPVDSNSIESQEITSGSFNEVASSNFNSTEHHQFASGSSDQFASITSNVAEHQQFASGSSNQVTPVTNNTTNHQQFAPVPSSQPTPVASKAAEQVQAEPISYGFPITNAQAIQAQVASTSFNQTQYTLAATGTFNYRQSVQHSADNGLWEQQSFDSQRRPTHNAAQNARVNTTSSTLQPIAHPRSAPANGLGNLASYKKPMPMWVEKGDHTGGNHYYTPLQRPEVVRATPQPQSNGTPSAPPNAIPAGTMTSDQLKETLAKVSGSFTMSLLRATLDAPTRTTSQRQLLRVVNLFGVDGKTNANISPNFRNSLDGIWTMFNTNAAYQKMMLIYVVEKILKQSK